jgi:regulator of replication initiation timing
LFEMNEQALESILCSLRDDAEALLQLIREQRRVIEEQRRDNERLRRENEALRQRLEDLERQSHRQAAPFRLEDEKRRTAPKKPGRPAGHAGRCRPKPPAVDETVEAALSGCPQCGGPVQDVRAVEQFIEDLPPVRPWVTRVVTYEGRCARCGSVRSQHPLQVSTAAGAAGVQIGPRAWGVALQLTHRHGLPKRATWRVLDDLFGLRLSPGGLVQAAHRLGEKLRPQVQAVHDDLRAAPAVHADETGWWVGGPGWQLWVFTDRQSTLYRVRPSRGREVVYDTLGPDFPGVLVSDCLSTYDDATAVQHKCYAHHHRAITAAMKRHAQGGEGFLREVRLLRQSAQALKKAQPDFDPQERAERRRALEAWADRLLLPPRRDAEEQAVANRLRKQRDHLFVFLDHPAVDATNNHAERQLRPAVIARKLSCGNRSPRGALTWERLTSLAVTAAQRGQSFREIVARAALLAPPASPT